jgi:hypothetical protein
MWDELKDWAKRGKASAHIDGEYVKHTPPKADEPIHILMRFSDQLHSVTDTIQTHDRIIQKCGAVWMGKLGKPLGHDHIRTILAQIEEGIPSYLFLVQRVGTTYAAYRGTISELTRSFPEPEQTLIPAYYTERKIIQYVGFWAKLTAIDQLDSASLDMLHIKTSGLAVPYTLITSMAAMFIIREGKGTYSR